MPNVRRLKGRSWFLCWTRSSSSTSLTSDGASTEDSHVAECQASCGQETRKRKRLFNFWKKSGSRNCRQHRPVPKSDGVILHDIIPVSGKEDCGGVLSAILDDLTHTTATGGESPAELVPENADRDMCLRTEITHAGKLESPLIASKTSADKNFQSFEGRRSPEGLIPENIDTEMFLMSLRTNITSAASKTSSNWDSQNSQGRKSTENTYTDMCLRPQNVYGKKQESLLDVSKTPVDKVSQSFKGSKYAGVLISDIAGTEICLRTEKTYPEKQESYSSASKTFAGKDSRSSKGRKNPGELIPENTDTEVIKKQLLYSNSSKTSADKDSQNFKGRKSPGELIPENTHTEISMVKKQWLYSNSSKTSADKDSQSYKERISPRELTPEIADTEITMVQKQWLYSNSSKASADEDSRSFKGRISPQVLITEIADTEITEKQWLSSNSSKTSIDKDSQSFKGRKSPDEILPEIADTEMSSKNEFTPAEKLELYLEASAVKDSKSFESRKSPGKLIPESADTEMCLRREIIQAENQESHLSASKTSTDKDSQNFKGRKAVDELKPENADIDRCLRTTVNSAGEPELLAVVSKISADKNFLSFFKDTTDVPQLEQADGKWLKMKSTPRPADSGSYVPIVVKEFVQKINANQPPSSFETCRNRNRVSEASRLTHGIVQMSAAVGNQIINPETPINDYAKPCQASSLENKQRSSPTLYGSANPLNKCPSNEEEMVSVVTLVAEASQTIADKMFCFEEGLKINSKITATVDSHRVLEISEDFEGKYQENEAKFDQTERSDKISFTVSDHQIDRKPMRSPWPAAKPLRIVKKVVEDIHARHLQGISETEVKFKKKRTPVVRQVSQGVQTILSNASVVDDKLDSYKETKFKYKTELSGQRKDAFLTKPENQVHKEDKKITKSDPDIIQSTLKEAIAEGTKSNKDLTEFCAVKAYLDKNHPETSVVAIDAVIPDVKPETVSSVKGATKTRINSKEYFDCGLVKQTNKIGANVQHRMHTEMIRGSKAAQNQYDEMKDESKIQEYKRTTIDKNRAELCIRNLEQNRYDKPFKLFRTEMKAEIPKRDTSKTEKFVGSNESELQQHNREAKMNRTGATMAQRDNLRCRASSETAEKAMSKRETTNLNKGLHDADQYDAISNEIASKYGIQKAEVSDNTPVAYTHSELRNKNKSQIHSAKPDNDMLVSNISKDTARVFTYPVDNSNTEPDNIKKESNVNRKEIGKKKAENHSTKYTFTSRSDLYTDQRNIVTSKLSIHKDEPSMNSTLNTRMRDNNQIMTEPDTSKCDKEKSRTNTKMDEYTPEVSTSSKQNCHKSVNQERHKNTHFGHVFPPMQPAMAHWYRNYVGETGELFTNSDMETKTLRLGAGLLQASARFFSQNIRGTNNLHTEKDGEEVPNEQIKTDTASGNGASPEGTSNEDKLISLGFTRAQASQALKVNDSDVVRAAEWLFSGTSIDSRDSPRTSDREAHARLSLHAPIDFIPGDIQEFYNKKKAPPTNQEEFERELALALLEVEPVPHTNSASDVTSDQSPELGNSVSEFFSSCDTVPCTKHGRGHRTDGDGAEDTTEDDRTETDTSGSRLEDVAKGSMSSNTDRKASSVAKRSSHLQINVDNISSHDPSTHPSGVHGQGCAIM